jgi:hypothetical protein
MRFVVLALLMSGGCATNITARESAHVDIVRGPPCHIRVWADGQVVSEVRWDKRCEVHLPEATR